MFQVFLQKNFFKMALILMTFERTSVSRSRKRQLNLLSDQYSVLRKIKSNQRKSNKQAKDKQQTTKNLNWVIMGKLQCIQSFSPWPTDACIALSIVRKWRWSVTRNSEKTQVLQSVLVNVITTICIVLDTGRQKDH